MIESNQSAEQPGRQHQSSSDEQTYRALLEDVEGMFPVPEEAAEAYLDSLPTLAGQVDDAILQRSDISDLIGSCAIDIITTNHRNHGKFMATVFALDLPALLVRVMPWAYRVYTIRGVSYEYFPAELSAWIRAIEDELDPAHARPLCRVYRWMMEHHDMMKQLSEARERVTPRESDWSEELDALLSCLLQGDSRTAQQMAEETTREAGDLPDFYVKRIQPVMYRVGSLWAEGEVTISQEHMVTAMVGRIIASTYQRFDVFHPSRGSALVSCATDEFHELGARTVADVLELDGWDTTFIGASVPEHDFHQTVIDQQPEIVALSATVPSHLLRLQRMVNRIREESCLDHTRIMAGGLAFSMAPEAKERLPVDGCAHDAQGASKLAKDWWEEGAWN